MRHFYQLGCQSPLGRSAASAICVLDDVGHEPVRVLARHLEAQLLIAVSTTNLHNCPPKTTHPQLPNVNEEEPMNQCVYHPTTPAQAQQRKALAPGVHDAFQAFSKAVFADGALPEKTKQLIAVAVAHVTQCPYCIKGHSKLALRQGNTPEEIMEAIWVAAEMRAGGAFAHSTLALEAIEAKQPHDVPTAGA
jgi:AhpD family alkylhydroperoxidase